MGRSMGQSTMARTSGRLRPSDITKLGPGTHPDGGGLILLVRSKTARSWVFRYRRHGRLREAGLGPVAVLGLAEARAKAIDMKRMLLDGVDPIEKRTADRLAAKAASTTFGDYAGSFIAGKESEWKNGKHRDQWRMTLLGIDPRGKPAEHDYCKAIRNMPIGAIETADVLKVLSPIWLKKPETARRIRARIENVLDAAKAERIRAGENAARWKGGLKHLLPTHKGEDNHLPALAHTQVAAFMRDLRQRDHGVGAACLEFQILTCVRPGNVVNAKWSQIDRKAKTWTIPASEMKANEAHTVPLSGAALAVLDRMQEIRAGEFIFPSVMGRGVGAVRRDQPMSNAALAATIDRLNEGNDTPWIDPTSGRPITAHGFRSTFRTWAAESGVPDAVAESVLAHRIPDAVVRAYQRSRFDDQRRHVMTSWANYVNAKKAGKVVPLRPGSTS